MCIWQLGPAITASAIEPMVLKIGTPLEVLRSALPPTAAFADMAGNAINDPLLQCTLTVPREVHAANPKPT
jgi:hypothetical protein